MGELESCADPKNWFLTGRRLSWRRCAVVLLFSIGLATHVFVNYSPSETAERIRGYLGCRGAAVVNSGSARSVANGGPAGRRPARIAPSLHDHQQQSEFVALQSDSEAP